MTAAHIHLITPNPTVDVHYLAPQWQRAEANRVQTVSRQVGGKGINSARLLHRWGADISTGGFFGADQIAAHSEAIGQLRPDFVAIAGRTRQAVIVSAGDGDTVFNEPGPTVSQADWQALQRRAMQHIDGAQGGGAIVSLHGSLPPGTPADAVFELVDQARRRGALTVVDTHGQGLVAAAKAGADFLLPNEHEAREVAGSARAGSQQLRALGAQNVIVTLGGAGMVWHAASGKAFGAKLPTPIAGHATGAGDAVAAALLAILAGGTPFRPTHLPKLVAYGAAAVACEQVGGVDEAIATQVANQVEITAEPVW